MTARAGTLQREEALRLANASGAATHRASLRLGAGLGAGARADLAGDRGRNLDLRRLADKRLFERDLHVVTKIGTALAARAAAAAAGHSKNALEDIAEG